MTLTPLRPPDPGTNQQVWYNQVCERLNQLLGLIPGEAAPVDLPGHVSQVVPHPNARVVATVSGTVQVPTAVGVEGQVRVYDNTSGEAATLTTTSYQTIEGESTQTVYPNCSVTLRSDGANWRVE